MIIDGLLQLSAAQAITVTAPSTNIIDLLNGRDLGVGEPVLKLAIFISTAFTAGGAATLTVQFQGAPDSSGSPGTYITLAESRAYAVAELLAGAKLLPITVPARDPTQTVTSSRFYRVNYVVATGPMTAGALSAQLVLGRQDNFQYPAGITILN